MLDVFVMSSPHFDDDAELGCMMMCSVCRLDQVTPAAATTTAVWPGLSCLNRLFEVDINNSTSLVLPTKNTNPTIPASPWWT